MNIFYKRRKHLQQVFNACFLTLFTLTIEAITVYVSLAQDKCFTMYCLRRGYILVRQVVSDKAQIASYFADMYFENKPD